MLFYDLTGTFGLRVCRNGGVGAGGPTIQEGHGDSGNKEQIRVRQYNFIEINSSSMF